MEDLIQLNLYIYLEYNDYISLINCNKFLYNYYISINCDLFYRHLLTLKFSIKFANNIYPIVNCYRLSFLSINRFEIICKKYNFKVLTEEDYYQIWKRKYKYLVC